MTRVAIMGANGQVGSEVCLILRNHSDIDLVPICRNRFGSSFLRAQGIRCRHGILLDPDQARLLLADCDVVANFALGSGSLREASDVNRGLIANSIIFSAPKAKVLYLSTVTVYGNPNPDAWFRWKNAYAREKLRAEACARREGRRHSKDIYVLRLGHVCGEFQAITHLIRQEATTHGVRLPDPDRKSNTVYTATIAEAILKVARNELGPAGTFDLLNKPQWSWRDVYLYEAGVCGGPLAPENIEAIDALGNSGELRSRRGRLIRALTRHPLIKENLMSLIARLSPESNHRIRASYYQNRAGAEIADLKQATSFNTAANWREVGWNFLERLSETRELLDKPEFRCAQVPSFDNWADDLPYALAEKYAQETQN